MTHFLVSALGSAGDVHPFIAISQALRVRGHDVRMIASPHFADRIRNAGISFAAMGAPGDYERLLQRRELWEPRGGARFILDELLDRLPEAYAATRALAGEPQTVLVGSTLAWGMRIVQEATGLPAATVHLSPVCVQSATAPPILPGVGDLSWMPSWSLRGMQWAAERLLLDRWIGPRLNGLRATVGLAPVRRIWGRWMHSPDLVVCAWPSWFAPPQKDWPPQAETSGFPLYDERGAGLDAALTSFLDAGESPIGITAGSAMAHGREFFAKGIAACAEAGRRVVLISPYHDQIPVQLPDWSHHVAYAPFSALVPRLSKLIHHGGIGTSAQALTAGIPQLVVPFAHDQFDNAKRLTRLGVARTVALSASTDNWVAAITGLEAESTVMCVRHYAARMRDGEPAADAIARRLEALALRGVAAH
ncbi:MAG: nucleotide disphospho-sugar-binding domain-containing protein [Burkholderiaceae bacterium]